MIRKYSLIILITSCLFTQRTTPLIVEFLQELVALSEFNRQNREALYSGIKDLIANVSEYEEPFSPWFGETQTEQIEQKISFDELPGVPYDAQEITEFLKNPKRFSAVGAQMPRGILLYGPPGTGKTSIARVIASEAGANFFHMSGSEFVELYVGVGPQRVRELFAKAHDCERAVIFIDEIDAIGGRRVDTENSEYKNTLNELLNQMDGFKSKNNVLVIAATNRIDTLDEALLRPGRFDRLVEVGLPNQEARTLIFKLYCSKIPLETETMDETQQDNLCAQLAHSSTGFSGADIKNIVNEAAILAARADNSIVRAQDVWNALEKARKQKNY